MDSGQRGHADSWCQSGRHREQGKMENSDSLWRALKKGKAVSRRRRRYVNSHADLAIGVWGGLAVQFMCISQGATTPRSMPWVLFHTPTESNTHSATLDGAVGCTHMFFSGTHTHAGQTYTARTRFLIQQRGWRAEGGQVLAIVRRNRDATGWRCRTKTWWTKKDFDGR